MGGTACEVWQGLELGGQAGQRLTWDHCTLGGLAEEVASLPRRYGEGEGHECHSRAWLARILYSFPTGPEQVGTHLAILEIIKPQNLFQRIAGPLWTSHSIP